jgi:hypothetical protein
MGFQLGPRLERLGNDHFVRPLLLGSRTPDCGLQFLFGYDPEFRPGTDSLSTF